MTPAPELVDRFRRDLGAIWARAFASDARLGLAVSGGGDSLALLLLANTALPGRIAVATVDHGLRPESAAEAAMVAKLCGRLAVPHETLAVTLAAGNVQDRARAARYGAMADWCRQKGLWALATAHQMDDQAETLLMRLNRGSGLAGLAGVRARGVLEDADLLVLRPLLGWRRSELADIVAAAEIAPACDPTNEDGRFDRARIRQALAGADWLDPAMLARSAALLGEAEAYVAERIDAACAQWAVTDEGEVRLSPGQSDFEAVEIASRIIADLGGNVSRSEVAALVARLRRSANASLGGVLARVVDGEWVFAPEPRRNS
jgi:tRNA(Ile)-lysidine synthase